MAGIETDTDPAFVFNAIDNCREVFKTIPRVLP
jgi:hypothetical protein